MSVADQSVPLANVGRRVPFTVRFSPQFVNRMCDRLQKSAPARASVAGLLYGHCGLDVSEIQVFKSFPDTAGGTSAASPQQLSVIMESLVASSRNDPEVSALQLIGWYAFRATGGLHEDDVDFHNTYFRQPNEVALILRPEQHPNVLFEIYTKSGTTPLSEDEHRWGALRLATDTAAAGPVDIAMRAKIGDDFYLRAYQVSKNLDRAERREHWVSAVEATKSTVRSMFRQKRKESYSKEAAAGLARSAEPARAPAKAPAPLARAAAASSAPEVSALTLPSIQRTISTAAPAAELSFAKASHSFAGSSQQLEPSSARGSAVLPSIYAGDPPALPAVIKQPKRSGAPWLSSVIVFAVTASATVLYLRGLPSGAEAPQFLRAIFPDTGLGLRVEGQGDRVLLSWNRRNAVVRSSQGGVLHIDDGPQHRDVRLDPAQIANGSVLYRPGSDDVSFRLEVHGPQGAAVAETMRVLDGAKAPPLEVKTTPPDVSSSAPVPAPAPAPAAITEVRSRRDGTLTTATTVQPTAARPVQRSAGVTPAKSPETTSIKPRETEPAAATLTPPSSLTPPHSDLPAPNGSAPAAARSTQSSPAPASSETSAAAEPTSTGTDSARPSAPAGSSDAAHPPDSSKVSNWEDLPSGKTAEPTRPRTPALTPPSSLPDQQGNGRIMPTFLPPKPVRQVLPDLKSLGPGSIRTVAQVEVAVKVNKKGRVTDAYLVGDASKVGPNVARAAVNAAKQWAFQPATLHGKTIASDHTIVFEFRPAANR